VKLGREAEEQQTAARIQGNPAQAVYLPKGVKGLIDDARQLPAQIEALRQLLSGL
jgi:hypothetical protein